MKKNISINICGTIYSIDEDAYQLLENYLQSMKNYFRNEEGGDEIADDIEHRVAELLWQYKEQGMTAVNIETIKEIIGKVGNHADIDDEAAKHDDFANNRQASQNATEGQAKENFFSSFGDDSSLFGKMKKNVQSRRFYRNAENKMLGGICSGMADYFGVGDVVFWRLGVLILAIICGINISLSFIPDFICFLISFPIPVIYLFIWITVPEARTPEDRLRMQGRDINPENIREQVVSDSEGNKKVVETPKNTSGGCLKTLLICFLLLLLLPFFLAFFVILFALYVVGQIAFGVPPIAGLDFLYEPVKTCQPMFWSGLIAALVVVCLSIYGFTRLFKSNKKPLPAWGTAIMIVVWLFALAVAVGSFCVGAIKYTSEMRENGIGALNNILAECPGAKDSWIIEECSEYGGLQDRMRKLRLDKSCMTTSCSSSSTSHYDEGEYVLESLTDVEGNGGSIKAYVDSVEVADNELNDMGQQLWTMNWAEGKKLPIFCQEPDSTGWDAFARGNDHWTYRVSKPFHHKGGDITITIAADNANLNKFNVRQVGLRKVSDTKIVTKTETEQSFAINGRKVFSVKY